MNDQNEQSKNDNATDTIDAAAAERFDARAAEKEREAIELQGRVAMLEQEVSRLRAAVGELIGVADAEPKGKAAAELARDYLSGKLDDTLIV